MPEVLVLIMASFLATFFDARHQLLFGLRLFDNDFDDPVALADCFVKIIFQVAGFDQPGDVAAEEIGGLGFDHAIKTALHDTIAHFGVLQCQPSRRFFCGQFSWEQCRAASPGCLRLPDDPAMAAPIVPEPITVALLIPCGMK